jgi:hypothetical protein
MIFFLDRSDLAGGLSLITASCVSATRPSLSEFEAVSFFTSTSATSTSTTGPAASAALLALLRRLQPRISLINPKTIGTATGAKRGVYTANLCSSGYRVSSHL